MRVLVWVDRRGQEQPLALEPRAYNHPRISPEGRRLAAQVLYVSPFPNVAENRWQVARDGGVHPAWAPDGKRLLMMKPAAAIGEISVIEERIIVVQNWFEELKRLVPSEK